MGALKGGGWNPLANYDIDTQKHKDEYSNTMCKNCHDNKCILINLDIESEVITAWLPKFGLKCKVMSKKKGW